MSRSRARLRGRWIGDAGNRSPVLPRGRRQRVGPLLDWLAGLAAEARARCVERIGALETKGHELRRPLADGLYELRVKFFRVNLRMLYFFHGRTAAVVSHGFSKEGKIPPREIKLAKARMAAFKANPGRHTYRPPAAADEET